ncbi:MULTISPECIES: hypothetical protein [Archaeoglobus]|jgi:hypothetical protein|uniref:Uncharacterized protein n=2 Tax=Archaeoglobus fulgidus TaxID=2234 RepID=A0A075WEC0_ARCFL|nr:MULTISPECIES: hypothetical protein [Archaeoglobus]AIG98032.1 hypothetical protein AFULGI_00012570 [Archaeoglobus fulgidus DSM 8774]KUJ92565.1 MAG: hypothetical protein XD40_2240 [Archaeoglobus fulgidus]KUK05683.1 MAG: hypothetical protein XD48_2082 [Archaeoglobus fulgidus]MDI3497645.1 hypothetical protein [Archaeoglobus sp.]
MSKRIYIETSIALDYIEGQIENNTDLKSYFRRELPRVRSLSNKFDFVILESSIGETFGQCLVKEWREDKIIEKLLDFLRETQSRIIRADSINDVDKKELKRIFGRGDKILNQEWSDENQWGLDIYDIWFLSQVSVDPNAKYIWANDRRMLDYGNAYINFLAETLA